MPPLPGELLQRQLLHHLLQGCNLLRLPRLGAAPLCTASLPLSCPRCRTLLQHMPTCYALRHQGPGHTHPTIRQPNNAKTNVMNTSSGLFDNSQLSAERMCLLVAVLVTGTSKKKPVAPHKFQGQDCNSQVIPSSSQYNSFTHRASMSH
jgi:hypothetical protein